MMRKLLLCLSLSLLLLPVKGIAAAPELIKTTYTVQENDSLNSITTKFIKKNTYGKRNFYEFREGIKELNPWLLERTMVIGDLLHINYWIDKEKSSQQTECTAC